MTDYPLTYLIAKVFSTAVIGALIARVSVLENVKKSSFVGIGPDIQQSSVLTVFFWRSVPAYGEQRNALGTALALLTGAYQLPSEWVAEMSGE